MTAPQNNTVRLGTRASVLARAQSELVKNALQQAHPSLAVKLVCITTPGDEDQKTPLTAVADPDFFSADLDQALLDNEVDICVHSCKDLPAERPAGIIRSAVPERQQPHDVILFRKDIRAHLAARRTLRVGACSSRREIFVRDFLRTALPVKELPDIEFAPLRGPVDERVQRIVMANGEPEFDAVVVALAGLNRLWQCPEGRRAIEPAMRDARLMVLPLSECPAAPGQGALVIECRGDDIRMQKLLAPLHDAGTAERLAIEADMLREFADPRLAGASAVAHPELGCVAWARGRKGAATADLRRMRTSQAPALQGNAKPWNDINWQRANTIERLDTPLPERGAVFAAHWRALEGQQPEPGVRVWVSGMTSWRKLAGQGIWVEGCADNLGFEHAKDLLGSPALHLPGLEGWHALTHADAVASWKTSGVGNVRATYRTRLTAPDIAIPPDCTDFYWSSSRQFRLLQNKLPADARHACGSGKTLRELRAAGVENVRVFVSRQDWLAWLG